jgi:hypothetical protein
VDLDQIKMTEITGHRAAEGTARHSGRHALLLGLAICGLLWILYTPYRQIYVPNGDDIPALADGLLLAPGARWQDWFTRGYSHFWDCYPEWPMHGSEFTRPAFQFAIYLAGFALGTDWASYQLINCFAVAGMGAVTFHIAHAVLRLRTALSLVSAVLVVLSPPVLISWLYGLAFAIEPIATVLVAGTFLAAATRRDLLCFAVLFLALLTKENTVWAPGAAAITIMLRPRLEESIRHRAFTAAAMFSPILMWLGLRFVYFGGIGGTYVTAEYTTLVRFLKLIFDKLYHVHYLFNMHWLFIIQQPRQGPLHDWGTALKLLDRGTALLIYTLLLLWLLRFLSETANHLRYAMNERRWPNVDAVFLVALWAAIAFAFHFALPVNSERYATSVVVFAWPALVNEVERRGTAIIRLCLGVCCVVSLTQASYTFVKWFSKPAQNDYRGQERSRAMGAFLREVPTSIRQIYVLSAGGLQLAKPEYVRLVLGVSAEIVRMADIDWKNCSELARQVTFDHNTADGMVHVTITLPACASFFIFSNGFYGPTNGHLYRNDMMTYDLPEADPIRPTERVPLWDLFLGRSMTVHIRPIGPARFIIQHGGPNGFAWFDTP